MDYVIKNLYTLFDAAWEENMNGRGTDITRMVTTFIPDAIQNLQAYEGLSMKKIGYDHYSEYEYYDIKDYRTCCTCRYFIDNELETRFECWKKERDENENCYENKYF